MSNHYKHILIEEVQHIQAVNPFDKAIGIISKRGGLDIENWMINPEWKVFNEANPPIVWYGPAFDGTKTDEEIEPINEIAIGSIWIDNSNGYYTDHYIKLHKINTRQIARPKEVEQVKEETKLETCKNCGCFVFDAECKKCVKCGTKRGEVNQPVQQEVEQLYLIDKKAAYNVYVAGFNHGFNERSIIPEHGTYEAFERLMNGESPCKDGTCYDIKKQPLPPNKEQEESAIGLLKYFLENNMMSVTADEIAEKLISRLSQEEKPLIELNEITDEDAIEVARITYPLDIELQTIEKGKQISSGIFSSDGYLIKPLWFLKVYQYLQSRGYKLPKYY